MAGAIYHNGQWYGLGGTTVVANPSGQATADLEKLQVGETIYEVVGQGGQGRTKTLLWGNMPFSYPAVAQADAELSADIKDFDEIVVYGGWIGNAIYCFEEQKFDASVLDSLSTASSDLDKQFVMQMNASATQFIRISKGSADNIIHFRYNGIVGIYAIVGIKYDGGGSSSEWTKIWSWNSGGGSSGQATFPSGTKEVMVVLSTYNTVTDRGQYLASAIYPYAYTQHSEQRYSVQHHRSYEDDWVSASIKEDGTMPFVTSNFPSDYDFEVWVR